MKKQKLKNGDAIKIRPDGDYPAKTTIDAKFIQDDGPTSIVELDDGNRIDVLTAKIDPAKEKTGMGPDPKQPPPITEKTEMARGCGFRKKGGIYFISEGLPMSCTALPIPLNICPSCGGGVKFSRGFTWISPQLLFGHLADCIAGCPGCFYPPSKEKAGLIWVGEKFYSTESFLTEAATRGISRRISTVPHGFKVGKTWVYFAHKKAIPGKDKEPPTAGIFSAFVPTRIEYVVKGNETRDELIALGKRGFDLVDVKKAEEQTDLGLK